MPLEKQLEQMLNSGDYSLLSEFKDPAKWPGLSSRESDLLALLFIAQGAFYMSQGDKQALENFKLASQIAPNNVMVFYRLGIAYSIYGNNMQCIIGACKAFQRSVEIDPNLFEGWYMWGVALLQRGTSLHEASHLEEAHKKFAVAESLAHTVNKDKVADLYGQWGLNWQMHGKFSEEACDFHRALEKYRQAADKGLNNERFWNDYADATAELAGLIGSDDLFLEAIKLYQKALNVSPESFISWVHIGFCYQRLFDMSRDEQFFFSAHEAYTHASEIEDSSLSLWLNWGILFADVAKEKRDGELFQMSFEKFAKADACEPNHPNVLCRWGEALVLCGGYADRVDLLREAESKIIRSLEIEPGIADTWYVYGACLSELGRYFTDISYYHQAIEKLQYGLTLNPSHPMLWHTLSLSHFAIGELQNDPEMVRKAIEYCSRVTECTHGRVPAEFWNDWGVALMKLAELTNDQSCVESAIEKFEKAVGPNCSYLEQQIGCPDWYYNYACALDFLGDFTEEPREHEKAVHVLSYLLEQDPACCHVRYNLALALSHLADLTDDIDVYHKSIEHFQILLENDHEDAVAWNDWGLTLVNLAELIHEHTNPQKSQELFEQAENKFQHAIALGNTQAFYNLACLYSLMLNFTAAMHYIERAEMAGSLPTIDEMLHDSWLDGLRQTPHFRHFLTKKNNPDL